ncbi:MAG: TonB-dependent receptor [Rubrivivax sp.]|nr:TonB-dependent receptor [Rubrivivax sp.]
MKQTHPRRAAPRVLLQATPVAAAVAAMLLGSSLAHAQTASADGAAPQVITVTGIRRGIESAINIKKNADAIVESISAEDIGKLPDSSIAESIARLPGLAAQRVNGRATEINIRGLSGDFANTLLNGREQVSTGNNRSVEFDQYPSELLSAVSVYKTPLADMMGQGLSGTIDLQTVRPLSFGQRTVSVNVRGEKNGGGTPFKGDGTRFNLTYIDQFADRTVGVAVGVARLNQKVTKSRSETYDTANTGNFAGVNGGADFIFNQGFKYFVDDTDETRTGAMAVLEYRPNKDFTSVVDLFYSEFDKDVTKRGLELQVNDSWKNGGGLAFQAPTLTNAVVSSDGRLQSGVWGNVNPLSRTIWEPRKDKLKSIGWNNKLKFNKDWSGVADLSYSSAESREQIVEMEAGVYDTVNNRPLPGTVTVSNYNQIAGLQYDHGNPAIVRLTDPESWGQNGYDKIISTEDTLKAIKLSASRDLEGLFSRVNFGINLTTRDKTKGSAENFLRLPAGTSSGTPLPAGAGSLTLPGLGFNTVSFDPGAAYPALYRLDANVNGDILRKGWEVNEDIKTVFVKADIDTELFGMPVRGNVGAQVVNSDQSSTAPVVDNTNQGQYTLRTAGKSYTDFLPALNLVMEMGNDQFLRAGLGRQMARPRMDQLSAFSRSEVNDQLRWTGSGGNPNLDPFRATALDVSYEKYFGTKGYVSVAAFYKDLKSYVFEFKNTQFDFTGFPNLSGRVPTSNIGEFTAPVNGKGGSLKGIELAVSVPLNLATPLLDGFGVQASYSDTKSAIRPFGDADTRPLPGLSRTVSTLTVYYEKYGFSARVASRKRSEFIAEIEGFGSDREYKFARPETVTDLQLGYEIQSGPAKGLNFLLQVNNVNNEPYREYDQGTGRDTKMDEYGRTTLFGVSYKF